MARPQAFWLGAALLLIAALTSYRHASLSDLTGFFLIVASALLPVWLWCIRAAQGIPIYPIFTLGTVSTFAFPLISRHPLVIQYDPDERLLASLVIAATNLAGTLPWYLLTRDAPPLQGVFYGFRPGFGRIFFHLAILAVIAFNLAFNSGMLDLDPAVLSLGRALILALGNLGLFVLGYRLGQRQLSRPSAIVFIGLTLFLILSSLPSGLMINSLSSGILVLIGLALGRGRLPWFLLGILVLAALFLQLGKTAIRDKYWSPASTDAGPVSLDRYPQFFTDWLNLSWTRLSQPEDSAPDDTRESQSFVERASLLHLFLLIQQSSPTPIPYLGGATYVILPKLLVPRVFNEDKARSHLGTYMLAIHYGLQRSEDTLTTTIGFGLINEAFGNFGYPGCLGFGLAMGVFYGLAARWSVSHPLLSFRALGTILVLTLAFQNEYTAGVYMTVFFQGACALVLLTIVAMRPMQIELSPPLLRRSAPSLCPPLASAGKG